jgi:hypothetical protein
MQATAFLPRDLLLRCLAMERKSYWVAMCIDLDLTVQASTQSEAQQLLSEQISSYVGDALGQDLAHADYLLRRRAPLRFIVLYHLLSCVSATKRLRSYRSPMPLIPAVAPAMA